MSDNEPQTYTFTITLLTLPAGAAAPATSTWQVEGCAVATDRESIVITNADGDVVALAPLGAVVVRGDALAQEAPAGAA